MSIDQPSLILKLHNFFLKNSLNSVKKIKQILINIVINKCFSVYNASHSQIKVLILNKMIKDNNSYEYVNKFNGLAL